MGLAVGGSAQVVFGGGRRGRELWFALGAGGACAVDNRGQHVYVDGRQYGGGELWFALGAGGAFAAGGGAAASVDVGVGVGVGLGGAHGHRSWSVARRVSSAVAVANVKAIVGESGTDAVRMATRDWRGELGIPSSSGGNSSGCGNCGDSFNGIGSRSPSGF